MLLTPTISKVFEERKLLITEGPEQHKLLIIVAHSPFKSVVKKRAKIPALILDLIVEGGVYIFLSLNICRLSRNLFWNLNFAQPHSRLS